METRLSVEIDSVSQAGWYERVAEFGDGNLGQLWLHHPEGERGGVSRLLLKDAATVVAAAEVRLFMLPGTNRGIAYVRWGPLWRRRNVGDDPEILRHALRALYQEYAVRRGLVLRVMPRLTVEDHPYCARLATDEHYVQSDASASQRTLLMPGTYHFKKGLAGKHGRDTRFVAELRSFRRSLGNHVLVLLDRTRQRLRELRGRRAVRMTAAPRH